MTAKKPGTKPAQTQSVISRFFQSSRPSVKVEAEPMVVKTHQAAAEADHEMMEAHHPIKTEPRPLVKLEEDVLVSLPTPSPVKAKRIQRTRAKAMASLPESHSDDNEGDDNDYDEEAAATKRLKKVKLTASEDASVGCLTRSSSGKPARDAAKTPTPLRKGPGGKPADSKKLTPMQQQVADLKLANLDKLLVVQLGYKYKMYALDAVLAAQILGFMLIPGKLTFDGSDPQDANHEAMAYCSFPIERLHINVKRLLANNLKIGVVEQTETSAIKARGKSGLFAREITQVYTQATYFDDELMTGGVNGTDAYIVCLCETSALPRFALVAVQPLTGDIVYDEFDDSFVREELVTRLLTFRPTEVLLAGEVSAKTLRVVKSMGDVKVESRDSSTTPTAALYRCLETAQALTPELRLVLEPMSANIHGCCLRVVEYLQEFSLEGAFGVPANYRPFRSATHMLLNGTTLASLEIFQNQTDFTTKGTLLWLLDHTRTPMGSRTLRRWVAQPLITASAINARLDAVEALTQGLCEDGVWASLVGVMRKLPDLEKALVKVHYRKTTRKELYLLLRGFNEILAVFRDTSCPPVALELLGGLLSTLAEASAKDTCVKLLQMVFSPAAMDATDERHVVDYFDSYYCDWPEIEELVAQIKAVEALLQTELELIRLLLGRPQLKYETVLRDGYLIEVRTAAAKTVPHDWLKIGSTKAVARFRPPEVSRLYKDLQYHQEMRVAACNRAYGEFMTMVDSHYTFFNNVVRAVAELDCLMSLCVVASSPGNVRPEFVATQTIDIREGRNPIVEHLSSRAYVANDIRMGGANPRAMVITGPNMGGKSSYVRQVAIQVIMAQIGSYVPATAARLGVFDSVLIRMGAQDNLLRGESTFMVEMGECAKVLQAATDRSLVILDEIGRGTGTTDGVALAYSILDYLVLEVLPLVLFITHYPSLGELEQRYPNVVGNFHMGFVETPNESAWATIAFLYSVERGIASNSYGLNVARLAGIPEPVLDSAWVASQDMRKRVEDRKRATALDGWGANVLQLVASGRVDRLLELAHSQHGE